MNPSKDPLETGHDADMAAQGLEGIGRGVQLYDPTADLKGVLTGALNGMDEAANGEGFTILFGIPAPTIDYRLARLAWHIARIRRNLGLEQS